MYPAVAGCGGTGCLLWASQTLRGVTGQWEPRGGAGAGGSAGPPAASLRSESVDQAVEVYGLQKITLLREISLKTGIQVGAAPWARAVPGGPSASTGVLRLLVGSHRSC